MNNTLYMIMQSNGIDTVVKVGYTTNLNRRMSEYYAYSPLTKLVSTCETKAKSKMKIEKDIHKIMDTDNRLEHIANTEFYKVLDNDFISTLRTQGLNVYITRKTTIVY